MDSKKEKNCAKIDTSKIMSKSIDGGSSGSPTPIDQCWNSDELESQ
jgi:hypothetical protein